MGVLGEPENTRDRLGGHFVAARSRTYGERMGRSVVPAFPSTNFDYWAEAFVFARAPCPIGHTPKGVDFWAEQRRLRGAFAR